jgi:hypothetical protein
MYASNSVYLRGLRQSANVRSVLRFAMLPNAVGEIRAARLDCKRSDFHDWTSSPQWPGEVRMFVCVMSYSICLMPVTKHEQELFQAMSCFTTSSCRSAGMTRS